MIAKGPIQSAVAASLCRRTPNSLLPARFETAAGLIEARLHRHNSELPILYFSMSGHHPHEVDRMTGHRNVWVKTLRHDHRVAVPHNANELWFIGIRVNKLHTKRGRRHVVINVKL